VRASSGSGFGLQIFVEAADESLMDAQAAS